MAIPRMFDCNTPFVVVTGGSEVSLLGKEDGRECEDDSLVKAIGPHLNRAMAHGTAKHFCVERQCSSEEGPCVSIIAQAEGEGSQEFTPTCTQYSYPRSQPRRRHRSFASKTTLISDTEDEDSEGANKLQHYQLHRKQRRKGRPLRQRREQGEEPPVIQGLWVQEIDWLRSLHDESAPPTDIIPPPPQFTDWVAEPCCSASRLEDTSRVVTQVSSSVGSRQFSVFDSGDPEFSHPHKSEVLGDEPEAVCWLKDTSAGLTTIRAVSSFDSPSHQAERDLDSTSSWRSGSDSSTSYTEASDCTEPAQSLIEMSDLRIKRTLHCAYSDSGGPCGIDTVLDGLRGRVTQIPKGIISMFFQDFGKYTLNDRKANANACEGILFHSQLQPHRYKYREGEEYCTLYHIQNGSYGDVFCVRDNSTGFECAAKRVALSHFNRDELSTWSALNSPRVVELFGAVREGANIVLFMDLKPRCLAQLLKERGCLPEDLALYYLRQLLEALEHLHHRHIVHLDVKVDNVLLSANGMETFLCDFGLSETLEHNGRQTTAFRRSGFPGTETHMAPEVAHGTQRCAKADVWSSCCMLLHMLNGCHPWIRYFSHPLCLKIVNEPPPLWEVPSNCNHFTAKVFRAGFQKDPDRRASARELRMKTTKALRAVGGLSHISIAGTCERLNQGKSQNGNAMVSRSMSKEIPLTPAAPTMQWVSPWRTRAVEEDSGDWEEEEEVSDLYADSDVQTDSPSRELESRARSLLDSYRPDDKDWETGSDSEVDLYMGEEECAQDRRAWPENEEYEGDWEEEEEEEEEEEWDSSSSTEYLRALRAHFPVLQRGQLAHCHSWGSEPELLYLRDGVAIGNGVQTPSPEPRDHPPSCLSCSDTSQIDALDKDSNCWSDDLSSGVFSSFNSQTDSHLEWLVTVTQPSSYCFEGVDIWIENIHGECLRIRERKQVKLGHVAIGISDQISAKSFSLETLDRKMVSFLQEITESGSWFRCVPAPDRCQRWSWRIKDGKLELRE